MTDNFKERVRSRNLPPKQPTQKEFSIEQWNKEFSSIKFPSIEDKRLYQAGLWFNKRFEEIRNHFDALRKYDDQFENLIRFQIGAINFSLHKSLKDLFEPYINVNLNQSQSFSSISCRETTNLTEVTITAARLSLSEIFKLKRSHKDCTSNKKDNSEELLKNWINSTISIAIFYDELATFWLDCVWNDWYVDTSVCHQDLLLPANQKKAVMETVSLYRSYKVSFFLITLDRSH